MYPFKESSVSNAIDDILVWQDQFLHSVRHGLGLEVTSSAHMFNVLNCAIQPIAGCGTAGWRVRFLTDIAAWLRTLQGH